jgi:MFS family permease
MDEPRQGDARGEWRRGWRIVLAASLGVGLGYGLLLVTAGLFVLPMQAELGWSRGEIMIGPIVGIASAPLSPFAGAAIDRYGARVLAVCGLALLIAAYLALALLPLTRWSYYPILALFAVAGTISSPLIYCKAIAPWFRKQAGLAFGITLSGLSIIGVGAIPLVAAIVERHGWRAGFLANAAVVGLIGIPVVALLLKERRTEAALSNAPAGPASSLRQAAAEANFWILLVSLTLSSLAVGGYLSQLNPIARSDGLSASAGAAAMTVYAVSTGIGRIVSGLLLDRLHPPRVAATCLTLAACGAALLTVAGATAAPGWPILFAAAILLGWGQGAEADYMAFFTRYLFGTESFGIIFGSLAVVVGGGIAIGGLLFAWSFDLTGSYEIANSVSIGAFLLGALTILAVRRKTMP